MEANISRVVRFGAGLVGLVTLGWILTGHAARLVLEGLPTDWTHRQVIFSQPATEEEAGRIAGDLRYWQQWNRQHVARAVSADVEASAQGTFWNDGHSRGRSSMQRDWSEDLGTGGTVGALNFPAKYSFGINKANCANATTPDFTVFSTGLTGSATQASIVAYDNLYSGCPTTTFPVPNVYWAYNTGGQILTSPVFSRDGSQVAFVQTTAGAASLVLLKWSASAGGTVGGPVTPATPTTYFGCTAPCMTTIALKSGPGTGTGTATNDTTSSVFYDYIGDTAWVGDGSSWLHQFTTVFTGTPTEVRTATWPVHVNAATPTALSSPVHDTVSGNVFVTDQGGFSYGVSTAAGTVTQSGRLDFGPAAGALASGPILDRTAQTVYVFASNDGTTNCGAGVPCAGVFQLATTFTGGTKGTEVTVGNGNSSAALHIPLYDGTFDNAYYASLPPRTGNLYVCGNTRGDPILYRVPITAGTFGTAVSMGDVAGAHIACSSVTDILNPNGAGGAEERAFFSVTNNGDPTACNGGGCAVSFVTMPWQAGTTYKVGQEILAVTSAGVLYINVAIAGGTSGTSVPAWSTTLGGETIGDGTVTWVNQGGPTFTALATWAGGHRYVKGNRIFDGANVEVITVAGISGGTEPTWPTTAGTTTTDGAATWINAGALPSAALPATGGTSGIIIDNTVGPGTGTGELNGASELYFSTLGNQACTTSGGTGGCAVQASQSALQ